MNNERKTCVIGNGYIGNKLKQLFQLPTFSRKDIDYHNSAELEGLCKEYSCIINASGYTGKPNVDACEKTENQTECFHNNVVLPTLLNEFAERYGTNVIHISTGCIFNDSEGVEFNINDKPNFGFSSEDASFYSRTKHAAEIALQSRPRGSGTTTIMRPRMPFDDSLSDRNYLFKILKYDTLLNRTNSKTHVDSFCRYIHHLATRADALYVHQLSKQPLNCVHPGALDTAAIVQLFRYNGIENKNWRLVDNIDNHIVAKRSNCNIACSDPTWFDYERYAVDACIKEMVPKIIKQFPQYVV